MIKINLKNFDQHSEIEACAEIEFHAGRLHLIYTFINTNNKFLTPEKKLENKLDNEFYPNELYKDTCFELFFKPKKSECYYEYHFALNGAYNAYSLSHYRAPLSQLAPHELSKIKIEILSETALKVSLPLPDSKNPRDYLINLTAVYNNDLTLEYFAPEHPKNKADFHAPKFFLDFAVIIGI